jgi:hypothetical protein
MIMFLKIKTYTPRSIFGTHAPAGATSTRLKKNAGKKA